MKHYRIDKVTRPGGAVLKKMDILASSDREAIERAVQSEDCPICEVRRNGKTISAVT